MRTVTRTVTKQYEIYQFKELEADAKEKAKNDYLIDSCELLVEDFENYTNEYLCNKYPNSELQVEFDFSCCQGSGLNIYGNFSLSDFNYTGKDDYSWLLEHVNNFFELRRHQDNYTYSLKELDKNNTINIIINDFNDNMPDYVEMGKEGKEKVKALINDIFTELEEIEKDLYDTGVDTITCISNEKMQEISFVNSWKTEAFLRNKRRK